MYVNYPDQDKVKKIAKRTLSIDELRSKAYKVCPPPPSFRQMSDKMLERTD